MSDSGPRRASEVRPETAPPEPVGRPVARRRPPPRGNRVRIPAVAATWFRLGLAGLWLASMALVVGTGQREADFAAIQSAVETGRVHTVDVSGGGLTGEGTSTQQVHWRDGGLNYFARVTVTSSAAAAEGALSGGEIITADDAGESLRDLAPDLLVTRDQGKVNPDSVSYGFAFPTAVFLVTLVPLAGCLLLLLFGPAPWRGTPWAWTWICLTGIGIPFFLALCGPTRGLPRPRPGAKRLTGGWCFLLFWVLRPITGM